MITTDDPYDDDPAEIADRLVLGAKSKGKVMDADLYVIPNRREAIIKAINLAQQDDLVLITGKGAEQFIAGPAGKKIPHDDRQVARDALDNLIKK